MKHVFEVDQVEEVDFLTGNERYKQDWMQEYRERWGLACVLKRKSQRPTQRVASALKALFRVLNSGIGTTR